MNTVAGLNDAIPVGLESDPLQRIDKEVIFVPPKTAKNQMLHL